ncbi:hypothetical protein NLI96_g1055 [Meripilus lineatus]|uniref:Uncharacterized protein n=1 Tax=Meripilus lineatus TaxID=2056292 RepID=A0AAD5VB05_9APHY|nr:hypothetical protein NLI96_g1055 [Physisporinus lineatus]
MHAKSLFRSTCKPLAGRKPLNNAFERVKGKLLAPKKRVENEQQSVDVDTSPHNDKVITPSWSLSTPLVADTWGQDIRNSLSNITTSSTTANEKSNGRVSPALTTASAGLTVHSNLTAISIITSSEGCDLADAITINTEDIWEPVSSPQQDDLVTPVSAFEPRSSESVNDVDMFLTRLIDWNEAPISEVIHDSPHTPPVPFITVTSPSAPSFNNLMALAAANPSAVGHDSGRLTPPPPSITTRRRNDSSSTKISRPMRLSARNKAPTSYRVKQVLNDLNGFAQRPSFTQRLRRVGGTTNCKLSARMTGLWQSVKMIVVPKPALPNHARR